MPAVPEQFSAGSKDELLYTAILATPADLAKWPAPGEPLDGLPGDVVSAALDRPLRPGEWRSEGGRPGPQESPPLLPAGSTWFLRADKGDEARIRAAHRTTIGRRREWGFGEVLIGTWRDGFAEGEKS